MSQIAWLPAALFLPLFPFSMLFNLLFARAGSVALRTLLLLAWPQIGLGLVFALDAPAPSWLLSLAVFTAVFYAWRALTLRELGQWTGFLATSLWSLLWLTATSGTPAWLAHLYALCMSAPLVMLALLGAGLERRFGAAYTGLYGGLAHTLPRFAGVLVVVVLASVATPLFPGFFAVLAIILDTLPAMPAAVGVLLVVWLLWTWAGARLLQGLVAGQVDRDPPGDRPADLSLAATWTYAVALGALGLAGFWLSGQLP